MANKFPNKLMLGLDMKDGKIAIKGWQESAPIALEQMFRILETVPVVAVLHTDINVEGQQGGINRERVDRFCKDCPVTVIISGGVTTEEDAKAAAKSGAGGVVVGMALYKGTMKPWTFGRPWVFKEVRDYLDQTGTKNLDFNAKLDILEELLRINVERIDEKRGILHTRRHLAATPIFKGIPDFRQTRIAMLRAETMNDLLAILEETRAKLGSS